MPKSASKLPGLPPVPFGQATALEFTDESRCGEFVARLPEAPSRFGAIGAAEAFCIRLKNVPLPSVSLVAGSSSPPPASTTSSSARSR